MPIREVVYSLHAEGEMHTQPPYECHRNKNHDRSDFPEAKKDRGKGIARGSLAKKMRQSRSAHVVHLSENVGNPPLLLHLLLVGRMPHTTPKIKDHVSAEEYAHMCKLSKMGKLIMMGKLTFQLL